MGFPRFIGVVENQNGKEDGQRTGNWDYSIHTEG